MVASESTTFVRSRDQTVIVTQGGGWGRPRILVGSCRVHEYLGARTGEVTRREAAMIRRSADRR